MKKIILLSFVAFTATLSFGQRKVDMSTAMTFPTASTIVRDNVPFTLNFTVTNLGPGVIKQADSIIFYFGLGTTLYPTTQKVFHVPADLAVNGTSSFSVPNLSITGAGGSISVCSHVILINRVLPDTVKDNALPLGGNNSSCVTLHFSGTGVGKVELGNTQKTVAYPNPASTNVSIAFNNANEGSVSVEIYDMQGRLVRTIDNGLTQAGDQSVSIDLTNMNIGVYFYKVISGSTTAMNKFIVE